MAVTKVMSALLPVVRNGQNTVVKVNEWIHCLRKYCSDLISKWLLMMKMIFSEIKVPSRYSVRNTTLGG